MDKGKSFLAPMKHINPDAVELACNSGGCALVPDDGNPDNDITPEQAAKLHLPGNHDEWVAF